jgi:hypothetical protein
VGLFDRLLMRRITEIVDDRTPGDRALGAHRFREASF